MTIHATRALLLSNLVRAGDQRRIGRLLDRLDPTDVCALLRTLHDLDLMRLSRILLAPDRVQRTCDRFSRDALQALVSVADDRDGGRALRHMDQEKALEHLVTVPDERRAALLDMLDPTVRADLIRALPRSKRPRVSVNDDAVGAAFRLRRLFAQS